MDNDKIKITNTSKGKCYDGFPEDSESIRSEQKEYFDRLNRIETSIKQGIKLSDEDSRYFIFTYSQFELTPVGEPEELKIVSDETVELLSKHMKKHTISEKDKKTNRVLAFKSLI